MKVGNSWLIANVRTLRSDADGQVIANVDFLGEGNQTAAGSLSSFRRGVTRYPIPGCEIMPVSTDDMRAIFAADDSPTSRSAPSIRPMIFAARSTSIRCCRSISRFWVNRHR